MKSINLICFPFAGGNKYSYRILKSNCSRKLNVITLEYPGRGNRIGEPFCDNIQLLVKDLCRQLYGLIDTEHYAFYGHSMGGLLAYLVTKELEESNRPKPIHIFISGTKGPSIVRQEKKHLLEKERFIEEIKKYGGLPVQVLEEEELLNFFEPILRADFKIVENFVYENRGPIKHPLTIITGSEDDLTYDEIYGWRKEAMEEVDFIIMPGNHFFIFNHVNEILKIIEQKVFSTFST